MTLWASVVVIGLLTFAMRLSFIALVGQRAMPPGLARALRFVPAAVLSAIIVPELLRPAGDFDPTLANPRWLAGLVAALVAWRTGNVLWTIGAGMAALLALQVTLGGGL